jgi:hypothetical protein
MVALFAPHHSFYTCIQNRDILANGESQSSLLFQLQRRCRMTSSPLAAARRALLLAALSMAGLLVAPPVLLSGHDALAAEPAGAQTPDAVEKEAFEAAKALGTVEAWDAFLSHYPKSFYSDLARAYLKQMSGQSAPPADSTARPPGTPEQLAYELTCASQPTLKSKSSTEPAKLRFVNETGGTVILQWIDFNGGLKEYARLKPGAELVQDTYITHPWIVAYEEGSCRQIYMPAPGNSVARIPAEVPNKAKTEPPPEPQKKKYKEEKQETLHCGKNYKKVGGKCVLLQNCGANAYRSPEGDCYCNKNYQMVNGQCVWKTDKKGFEVAPWKKSGCSTWQQQCNKGNAKACGKYEANCQVN